MIFRQRRWMTGVGLMLGLTALGGAVVAAGGIAQTLFINGKPSAKGPIVQNGQVYVPVSALAAAGAEVSVAKERISIHFIPIPTKNEQPYVEGILGEYVTSGIWRIKVSNVKKIENPIGTGGDGYEVQFEAQNMSKKTAQIAYTGVEAVYLLDTSDNRLAVGSNSFPGYYADIQPAGSFTNKLQMGPDAAGVTVTEPAKLIIQFAKPDKSIRINLRPTP